MSTAGQQLFNEISAGLWSVLERYRSQGAAKLATLKPLSGFEGTVLDGRLLEPLNADDIAADDPGVSGTHQWFCSPVAGFRTGRKGHPARLLPAPDQPRGLALAVTIPAPQATFVMALTGDGPTGIAIEFAAVGAAALDLATELGKGWSLALSGNANGGGRLQFPRGGPSLALDGKLPLSVQLTLNYNGDPIELGADSGPHVTLGNFSVGIRTAFDAAGAPKVSWILNLPKASLSLVADVVAALLGEKLKIPIDLNLSADAEVGLAIVGGGVRASLPANLSVPGVDISGVDLEVSTSGGDVQFSFGMSFTASLPGFPLLTVAATGLGASFPISTGTANLGLNLAAIRPTLPTGLGIDLALPVISGGGILHNLPAGGYGGGLELNLLVLTIKALDCCSCLSMESHSRLSPS